MSCRCPAVVTETWHAERGSLLYAYQFEDTLPAGESGGSQHSDEVSFVFGTLNMMNAGHKPPPQVKQLSDAMVRYWANFAKQGDPNSPRATPWPRLTAKSAGYLHLNGTGIRAGAKLCSEAYDLFRDVVAQRLLMSTKPP
jgi:para-nitrobenzyl esterase